MSGCHKPDCLSQCCKDLLNKIGELSMKVNEMASSLRTFEKERVNPKFEEVRTQMEKHGDIIDSLVSDSCRLNDIPLKVSHLEQKMKDIEWLHVDDEDGGMKNCVSNKKPHKCPACDGEGFRLETEKFCEHLCVSCEGKGIVWG